MNLPLRLTPNDAVRGELRAGLSDLSDQLLEGTATLVLLNCVRHLHALLTLTVLEPDQKEELRALLQHVGNAVVHDRPIDRVTYANRITRQADRV